MLMLWRYMTTLCQQLHISHCRLLLQYPRFALSMTIGIAHQINYPLCCPLICALWFRETLLLVWNSKWSRSSKVFGCGVGKKWWPVLSAASSIQGAKWVLTNAAKCTSMFHCSIIWTVLEPTCKRIWRPAKVLCGHCKHYAWYKQRQISFLLDQLDKGFQLTNPNWLLPGINTALQAISET